MNKISVIVPIYNVQSFLPRCLDSIMNQTYKNLEIILVNDGSTDNSKEIAEQYLEKDERFRLINKENGGLSSARNAGLDVVTGQYISFVDSDDWLDLNMYSELMKHITEHNADLAECQYIETSGPINPGFDETKLKVSVLNNIEALHAHFAREMFLPVVWNKLYKREIFKEMRFPEGKLHEDEFITYKVLYSSNKMVSINKPLYFYYQRSDSIMGAGFSLRSFDKLEAFNEKLNFFKGKDQHFELMANKQYINTMLEFYCRLSSARNIPNVVSVKNKLKTDIINKIDFNKVMSVKNKMMYKLFLFSPELFVKVKQLSDKVVSH